MSGGFWYCHKTSLPSSFRHSSLSIALPAPLPVPSWWPEHEGAICHSALIPARVLRARHSPLTRLGCHVRWLTGKVTSGDKRPQLESVSTPPLHPFLSSLFSLHKHAHTHTHTYRTIQMYTPVYAWKICSLYLYRQPSESSRSIDFLHFATAWHSDRGEGEQKNRRGRRWRETGREWYSPIWPLWAACQTRARDRGLDMGQPTQGEAGRRGREGCRDEGSEGIERNGDVKKIKIKKGGQIQTREGGERRWGMEKNTVKKTTGGGRGGKSEWNNEAGQVERRRRRRECSLQPPIDRIQSDWQRQASPLLIPLLLPRSRPPLFLISPCAPACRGQSDRQWECSDSIWLSAEVAVINLLQDSHLLWRFGGLSECGVVVMGRGCRKRDTERKMKVEGLSLGGASSLIFVSHYPLW